ncbi:nuclear transport factor 2 family protein [Altererythrobacter fulvus]|uniref:nuclear transport factor 2 family protein n=1 Tax=Caenibius fulvus TaxID=2126012 RepID=UPI0030160E33
MAPELSIADQLAIRDVISRYAWALDTGDVEDFVTCFCSDGALVWDAFETPMRWQGHDALRHFATFFRDLPTSAGRQHHVTNTIVSPSPDGARARSYAAVALRQGDGPHLLHVMGYYEDLFRQEDGKWGLAERVIRDWSGPILKEFAGQTGEHVARPMPPPLAGALFPGNGG